MRILLLNHFPLIGSGSGVYTLNIANSLTALGHDVVCIFPTNEVDATQYKFRVHPVYFMAGGGEAAGATGDRAAGAAVQSGEAAGATGDRAAGDSAAAGGSNQLGATISNPLSFNFPCFTTHPKSSNTFEALSEAEYEQYAQAFREAIDEEIKSFKPDVIHAGHIWVLPALACETGLPVVITAHGTDIIGYKQSARYHNIAHAAASGAAAIVSISERNYAEVVETFSFAKDKTILISNGYDENRFYVEDIARAEVLARYGITREYKKMVSFAGKFAHFKGIDILLHAAAEYEDEDTLTILAGNGELFSDMKALAAKLGLKHVAFIGAQTPDALRSIYSVADVSCAPSRREPFGLVVIEAGACGVPVVGTNGGGIADILKPDTGILIDEEDAGALAAAIQSVLSGSRTFDRAHIAAYTREHFAQSQYTKKLVDEVYSQAI